MNPLSHESFHNPDRPIRPAPTCSLFLLFLFFSLKKKELASHLRSYRRAHPLFFSSLLIIIFFEEKKGDRKRMNHGGGLSSPLSSLWSLAGLGQGCETIRASSKASGGVGRVGRVFGRIF